MLFLPQVYSAMRAIVSEEEKRQLKSAVRGNLTVDVSDKSDVSSANGECSSSDQDDASTSTHYTGA